ncbi:AraC family transcriptional regulator [Fimbriimonas ginsengisoli Gsoil 348]|uniref:AraC family transcriptional regulator n=2 Tax=Fimbriimonas ginsengisoli TaxID=1005039 RepID=A0A068NVW2_FIMGI|nr:AraC family transcriptional regulator [Fimbriimonas ginsengisoli Gsoil 348]
MNVLDRMIGAHYEGMKQILDRCEGLTEVQLDRPVSGYYDPLAWMSQHQTLRSLLRHTTGASDAPVNEQTVQLFRASLDKSYQELRETIATYEREKMWDMTFVDADCDPPMVFSYGGWIGHVLVFHNYRRIACMMALAQLGVSGLKYFDPIDFQG